MWWVWNVLRFFFFFIYSVISLCSTEFLFCSIYFILVLLLASSEKAELLSLNNDPIFT